MDDLGVDAEVAGAHFEVLVIGSGFGGSVMAYRCAEAGLRVCLLERGKAYAPGDFPRSPHRMKSNFWDPSAGLQGLFNLWSFSGLDAIVASGLGGGSLIYANVLLRKDERWFVREDLGRGGVEYWPVTRADLDRHYDAVERMIGVQRLPAGHPPYDEIPKTRAMREAAETLGLEFGLPPLAVTFANPGKPPTTGVPIEEAEPNLHGRLRLTCRLCGECDIGCNYGSKNTLDLTCLSAAVRKGLVLRTRCEVRGFTPRPGGGYCVTYVEHDPVHEGEPFDTRSLPLRTVFADRLVLAAGTFGSSFLLLKNQAAFPDLSPRLGSRFSGNGDLLTFALKSGSGGGASRPRVLDPAYGPVITSFIRVPDTVDGGDGRGFYIEDAGYPEFVNWMIQMADAPSGFAPFVDLVSRWIRIRLGLSSDHDLGAEISGLLGAEALTKSSLPLLGMGRDIPNGRMRLDTGLLDVDWQLDTSASYFRRVRGTMRRMAEAFEAEFLDNPAWYLSRVITVHPLGGCPMGRDSTEGVVDPWGRVFGYPGLYVADGSVMPGPVGANPSLTIAALANRFAERLIEEAGGGR